VSLPHLHFLHCAVTFSPNFTFTYHLSVCTPSQKKSHLSLATLTLNLMVHSHPRCTGMEWDGQRWLLNVFQWRRSHIDLPSVQPIPAQRVCECTITLPINGFTIRKACWHTLHGTRRVRNGTVRHRTAPYGAVRPYETVRTASHPAHRCTALYRSFSVPDPVWKNLNWRVQIHRHTHIEPTALPGPLKWWRRNVDPLCNLCTPSAKYCRL